MTEVKAFGQSFTLNTTKVDFIRNDSLWRLKAIYEPVLASQTLPPEGVALDIGAGFGIFAVPFATVFPGWQVYCFEPDPETYAVLLENIAAHRLTNVTAFPFAVGTYGLDAPRNRYRVRWHARQLKRLGAGVIDKLGPLLPQRDYSRHKTDTGFVERGQGPAEVFDHVTYPTLAAGYLAELKPTLLKMVAPHVEAGILADLRATPINHILGEIWAHVPAELVYDEVAGQRQTYLPVAGPPLLTLRRSPDLSGHVQRLDVVVAMYNSRAYILECVAGILNGAKSEVHVIVVDDGSTDGAAELVQTTYRNDPRVRVIVKPNGGCASARNYGRMHSNASHIAFVDADDVPGPGLYAGLLDLARHTGAEVVQGGFELLHDEPGGLRVEPSYEPGHITVREAKRHAFGSRTCHLLRADFLMTGQPTIWRRVYRRDFLDNRKIWFPEHIRAFDDQIFQILTLQAVHNVPVLDGVTYGYRQHPGQDIRQGDERNFYSLEMFRLVLKRALAEGWADVKPVLTSYVHTVNWITGHLRPDLRPHFIKGAAELWTYAGKALGPQAFVDLPPFLAEEFAGHVAALEARLASFGPSYAWTYLDSFEMQVPMVKSLRLNG